MQKIERENTNSRRRDRVLSDRYLLALALMQTIGNRMYVQIRTPHSPLMHPTIRLPE